MSESYALTKDELILGIKQAKENAILLAKQALFLTKKKEHVITSLGLYSFALEEWGKCLLLHDSLSKGNYQINIGIFRGSKPHKLKFSRGLDDIPNECKHFRKILDLSNETTILGKHVGDHLILHGISKSGKTWKSKIPVGDFLIDFNARMDCFYLDWDDHNRRWKKQNPVDRKDLQNKIKNFLKYVNSKNL